MATFELLSRTGIANRAELYAGQFVLGERFEPAIFISV